MLELQHEIELLRGALQFIGDELAQLNPAPTRAFIRGHSVFYDGTIGRYVLDYSIPLPYEDLVSFLGLEPEGPEVDKLLRLVPAMPIGPRKV